MIQNNPPISRLIYLSIVIGVGLFIIALTVSAVVVPSIRLLHLFQALIYVAVIVLARRNSPWGFGIGVFIPVIWNSLNLFITHLFAAGAGQLWLFIRTGHADKLDTLMVLVGGVAHFILIAACLAGFLRLRPTRRQWGQFIAGGFLAIAYLALIVLTMAPH